MPDVDADNKQHFEFALFSWLTDRLIKKKKNEWDLWILIFEKASTQVLCLLVKLNRPKPENNLLKEYEDIYRSKRKG